jgi:hypothetical protein
VTCNKCDFLDGKHVVFGKILDGMLVMRKIENVPTGPNNRPKRKQALSHKSFAWWDFNPRDTFICFSHLEKTLGIHFCIFSSSRHYRAVWPDVRRCGKSWFHRKNSWSLWHVHSFHERNLENASQIFRKKDQLLVLDKCTSRNRACVFWWERVMDFYGILDDLHNNFFILLSLSVWPMCVFHLQRSQ